MKFRLRIRAAARDDLRDARDWYRMQSADLAERFAHEIGAVFSSVEERPLIYAKVYKDVRRAMTRRFPYGIYFVVEGDRISVLRVLHQARDPRHWPR